MPLRAFLFSLDHKWDRGGRRGSCASQCPCGRFCFLSQIAGADVGGVIPGRNALAGVFVFSRIILPPFHATRWGVAMPLRAFLFSLWNTSRCSAQLIRLGRNALAGVFVFSRLHRHRQNITSNLLRRNALAGVFVFSQNLTVIGKCTFGVSRNALAGVFVFSP